MPAELGDFALLAAQIGKQGSWLEKSAADDVKICFTKLGRGKRLDRLAMRGRQIRVRYDGVNLDRLADRRPRLDIMAGIALARQRRHALCKPNGLHYVSKVLDRCKLSAYIFPNDQNVPQQGVSQALERI